MKLDPAEIIPTLRDSAIEAELATTLRTRSIAEQRAFFHALLDDSRPASYAAAIDLIRRVVQDHELFAESFCHAAPQADASTIRYWIELGVCKLGFRRVLALIGDLADGNPQLARKAHYWLAAKLDRSNPRDREAWREFQECMLAPGV